MDNWIVTEVTPVTIRTIDREQPNRKMIDTTHRFHGYNSLRYVYRAGKTSRGSLSALKYSLNPKREAYRLAVVVSKKVSKSAVVRNRIRRRVYELVRRYEAEITQPYDLVLTIYSDRFALCPAIEIEQMVLSHLRQAGVLAQGKRAAGDFGFAKAPPG